MGEGDIRVRGRFGVRRGRIVAAITLVVFALQLAGAANPASADPPWEVEGQWSDPFDLQVIGIHTTLLPTGRVLIFQRPKQSFGSDARTYDPITENIDDVSFTAARDVFCAGHSLLPDGTVLVTGGHAHGSNGAQGAIENDIFDPVTETWTSAPPLTIARWYPTNVEMGDGRTLIFGGQVSKSIKSPTVDVYDPVAGTVTQLPDTATLNVGLYPRTLLMSDGRVFMAGPNKVMRIFDPATNAWSTVGNLLAGNRGAGNSVVLPGLNRILAAGGQANGTLSSAEIIDLSGPTPTWRYTASMTFGRKHASSVLLPDGTVLEVGGGKTGSYGDPVFTSELFDPVSETWSVMDSQTAPRMYHSSAVLLPDGRVLSLGQDKQTSYAKTGELYSPPYLFHGDRPTISVAPPAVAYGTAFTVESPEAADITRIALVSPGSDTHSVNMSQRYVDSAFALNEDGTISVSAPADGNVAPPGWYMLFLLNSEGIPSVASWVHVGPSIEGFAQAPKASPTRNDRSTPSSDRPVFAPLLGGGSEHGSGADGLTPAGPVPLWTPPKSPDGFGVLNPGNPLSPELAPYLLICTRGPPG